MSLEKNKNLLPNNLSEEQIRAVHGFLNDIIKGADRDWEWADIQMLAHAIIQQAQEVIISPLLLINLVEDQYNEQIKSFWHVLARKVGLHRSKHDNITTIIQQVRAAINSKVNER